MTKFQFNSIFFAIYLKQISKILTVIENFLNHKKKILCHLLILKNTHRCYNQMNN